MSNTPRTDEQIWTTSFDHKLCDVVDVEFAKQLERKLAASLENQLKAMQEVEKLKLELAVSLANQLKAMQEVERLRQHLDKAIKLAEEIFSHTSPSSVYHMQYSDWKNKLGELSGISFKPYYSKVV